MKRTEARDARPVDIVLGGYGGRWSSHGSIDLADAVNVRVSPEVCLDEGQQWTLLADIADFGSQLGPRDPSDKTRAVQLSLFANLIAGTISGSRMACEKCLYKPCTRRDPDAPVPQFPQDVD